MSPFLEQLWYGSHPVRWVLLPFSWMYRLITAGRYWFLSSFCRIKAPVPILVVGNLTLGGVGKTPLVIALAEQLKNKGLRVGIVSRGYGAGLRAFPYEVQLTDSAQKVGDEPLLLAQKTACPVIIAPKRNQAVAYLLEQHKSQIIISDDGLQHYRMGRSIEFLVIDGTRGLGNGLCLPAGPLREPQKRLKRVDFVVVNEGERANAYSMTLKPGQLTHLKTKATLSVDLVTEEVAAVAAIGNPQRFYTTLSRLGIRFKKYSYPDHYQFISDDLNYPESLIIMTEKDAVKCRLFHSDRIYYLPVEAVLNDAFWDALWSHPQLQGYA